MIIISHRGNVNGRDKDRENNPKYIKDLINKNINIEVDLWRKDNKLFLGHDLPQYLIDKKYLEYPKFWIHAKNLAAVEFLMKTDLHWFWHDIDKVTLTSKGFIWCYPGYECEGGIMVDDRQTTNVKVSGICTDFLLNY